MNESSRKHLSDWLRDAHAMEVQADNMLRGMAGRLEHYPELQSRIEKHIEETKGQLEKLETVIDKADMSTSAFKDAGAKFAAMGQAMSGMFTPDEVVKGGIANLSFEHFEIANYKALISAAEYCGEPEVKRVCEEILKEEEEMAKWLDDNLPAVTQAFLARAGEDDVTAKH